MPSTDKQQVEHRAESKYLASSSVHVMVLVQLNIALVLFCSLMQLQAWWTHAACSASWFQARAEIWINNSKKQQAQREGQMTTASGVNSTTKCIIPGYARSQQHKPHLR